MKWFQGSIPVAIQTAKQKQTLFVVYVRGNNEMSDKMDKVWEDERVASACESHGNIVIKIQADSEEGKYFGQIYPVILVPSTYFIATNGVPQEVTGGFVETDKFIGNINTANQKLQELKNSAEPAPGTSQDASPVFSAAGTSQNSQQEVPTAGSSQTEGVSTESDTILKEKTERANELRMQLREEKKKKEEELLKTKEEERRQLGKNMQRLKQYQADRERKEDIEQMRKDREENKKAKEKIKEQIARDREERAARYKKEKEEQEKEKEAKKQAQLLAQQQAAAMEQARKSDTARIQIRLPDGSSISNTFSSSETLNSVHQFVSDSMGSDMSLSTTFPKRYFTDEDRTQTLAELGLAPSAVMIAVHRKSAVQSSQGGGGGGVFSFIFFPFVALWNFVYMLIFGGSSSSGQETDSNQQNTRQVQPSTSSSQRPTTAYQRRGDRPEGNIHRFSNTMDKDDNDDRTTWNGNSTQQM